MALICPTDRFAFGVSLILTRFTWKKVFEDLKFGLYFHSKVAGKIKAEVSALCRTKTASWSRKPPPR
jgi:hypothetical protein